MLSQILRTFSYRDKKVLPQIFKTYVRPQVEFAVRVWNPWTRGDIDTIEKVQKRLVRQIPSLKGTTYEEKLRELNLESLEQRRDLIQTFKIIHGHDRVQADTWFKPISEERQHRTRLAQTGLCLAGQRARTDLRANFYSQRVVQKWNGLPSDLREI